MNSSAKSIFWKVIILWAVFAFLHYANDIFPNPILAFIGEKEGTESIFGHSKMNFWTYLLVTIGEFLLVRKKITDGWQYWHTRMLSAVTYPWFALTFWMTGSALNGGAELARPLELFFALAANVFGAYVTVALEQVFDRIKFRKATQWAIVLLFLMALTQYISYELQAPWWNFFGSN